MRLKRVQAHVRFIPRSRPDVNAPTYYAPAPGGAAHNSRQRIMSVLAARSGACGYELSRVVP